MKLKNVIVIAVVIMVLLLQGCIQQRSEEDRFMMPPLIYVNGTLYKSHSEASQEEVDNCVYLGEIQKSVSPDQAPYQELQANSDIVGAAVYNSGSDIVVLLNDQYWKYCELT